MRAIPLSLCVSPAAHPALRLVFGTLVAGLFPSCDQRAMERPAPARAEPAAAEIRADLPAFPAATLERAVIEPSPTPDDSAPQTAPSVQLASVQDSQRTDRAGGLKSSDRARAIFATLAALPPEALAGAAEQAVEKLTDADYSAIALPVIVSPQTNEQVLSVMFADLLERPATIALPALLSIAKTRNHPFGPAAFDDLRLLLEADYGSDWAGWDKAIREKLATDNR